jgi:hypothetical protein
MTDRKRKFAAVAALVGLSCLVQAALVRRAALPAQDSVGFVRFAQKIDQQGLLPTLRAESQQPLFPVTVWLVHRAIQRVGGPLASDWALSAQLAAAAALVLAVVPVYFIGLRLVGPRGAAAGAVMFCVLPEVARLGADGLSDSTHLLLFALAFWAVAVYFTGRSLWLIAAGGATAAALLARAEAIVLPAALALSMLAFQLQPNRRQPWRRLALGAGGFLLGFAVVFLPYLTAVGPLAPRAAVGRMRGTYRPPQDSAPQPRPPVATSDAVWRLPDGRPMSFAYKETSISIRHRGYGPAIGTFADELAHAFGGWIGLFALFGVWRLRRTPPRRLDRLVQVFFLLYVLAAVYHAAGVGYLSARHLLPLVAVSIGCVGYGLAETAGWIAQAISVRQKSSGGRIARRTVRGLRTVTAWATVVLAAVACLICQAEPLHAARQGHRSAGDWLAREAGQPGPVLDTLGFTGLYSGRPTYASRDTWAALCDPGLAYVVLERWEIEFASDRGRTLRVLLEAAAEPVAEFPQSGRPAEADRNVLVYRWSPQRYLDWLAARETASREPIDAATRPRLCRHGGRDL